MPLDQTYWKDTLLCDYDNIIEKAENISIEEFKNNKKYSHRILSAYFKDLETRDILIERLFKNKNNLKEFLLLEGFTKGTLQNIVGKILELNLTKSQLYDVTKQGHKASKEFSKYDKFAGIIKLYQKDPMILIKIQLLEKINRKSQSKFEMEIKDYEKFRNRIDSKETINKDLELFDKDEADNKNSKFIGWFDIDDDIYLYFIREYKRSMTLKIKAPRFDTVCEWIIFRIPIESDQIRVSYESNIDIKRFIPTIINGWQKRITSEEDIVKDFEVLNSKENVELFFDAIIKEESVPLVEVRFDPAPFKGAPILILSDKKNQSLKPTIKWFEENKKNLFKDISIIKDCKIYFNRHRLKIKFSYNEEGMSIRYLDSNLQIDLRKEFEKFMLEKFKLTVIPGV